MVPSQLATRSTHLTENGETNSLSEHVQRGYFTSVAQPTSFALFGLIGLFPGLFHRNVTFQTSLPKLAKKRITCEPVERSRFVKCCWSGALVRDLRSGSLVRRSDSLADVSLLEHSYCDSKNGEPPVQHDWFVASLDLGSVTTSICSPEGVM